jgi:Ca2+-binding RTX toxin-like protein
MPAPEELADLLGRAAAGDTAAVAELFSRYRKRAQARGGTFHGSTAPDDTLRLLLGDQDDVAAVVGNTATLNDRLTVTWTNLDALTLEGGAGNDLLSVTGTPLAQGVLLKGGDDDDVLVAGSNTNLLLGGAGNDQLFALAGRHLLIGGAGRDLLFAADASSRSGSILIGGSTLYDGDDQALRALLAEWSSRRSLRTRIANLTDGSGSRRRRNGNHFLNADTLVDDGIADLLVGDARADWFLPFPENQVVDGNRIP